MTAENLPNAPAVLILRHGQTLWNRDGRYQGQNDSPLTPKGIGQVRALAETIKERLGRQSDWRLVSSPLPRTRQSMALFCEQLGWDYDAVEFDARLKECAYGRWEGLNVAEIERRFPEDYAARRMDHWGYANPEGGESYAQVCERVRGFVTELDPARPVVVMSHGGAGRVLRGILLGLTPDEMFVQPAVQSQAILVTMGVSETISADPADLIRFGAAG
jgi:broad specificity phosphatase PhoE